MWFVVAFFVVSSLCALALLTALGGVKRRAGASRTEKQIALPLAMIERACTDAVAELCKAAVNDRKAELNVDELEDPPPIEKAELYVSPFDPATSPVASLKPGDLRALGGDAKAQHKKLVAAMRQWNAAAGTKGPVDRLLPAILVAHEAAQKLAQKLQAHVLDLARRAAEQRVLISLVAMPPQAGATVH